MFIISKPEPSQIQTSSQKSVPNCTLLILFVKLCVAEIAEKFECCMFNFFYFVGTKTYSNPAYNELLKSIKNKIKEGKFFLKDNTDRRTILRIGIHSLGSPMWLPHRKSLHSIETTRDLDMFIFCLRALVRSAYAVAVVTIPTHLYHEVSA